MQQRTIPEQYFAALDAGDVAAAAALLAPNAEFSTPAGAVPVPEGARAMLDGYVRAFPGNRFEVTRTVASSGEVAVEGVWVGKHTGPLSMPDGSNVPATGRTVRVPYVTMFRVEANRIASHRAYWDMASFLGQLGLL
jgi:steroid delta-isomerase-like uncharacterized protein